MGHFAKVLDGVVVQVIVAEQEFFDSFVDNSPGEWLQTSYNTRGGVHYDSSTGLPSEDQSKAFRKNFASVGFSYDKELDAFIPTKPFPSWSLDSDSCLWIAPIPKPIEGSYDWDEANQQWISIKQEQV